MIAQKNDRINVLKLPYPELAAQTDPHSNTGSNSLVQPLRDGEIQSRLDNISLLWKRGKSQRLVRVIDQFLGVKFDINILPPRKIGVMWDRNWTSVTGTLYSERDTANGDIYCRLSISGQDCERATNDRMWGFLRWARNTLFGLTCSRLDICVDDYKKELNSSSIEQALIDGNYTGVRSGKVLTNYGGKYQGFTVSLGSRDSEKYIRFYDKFAESHGRLDCYRWEVEYKGDLANKIFNLILECPRTKTKYQRFLINIAVSCIDFIDKNDKNITRNIRLEWWEAWLSRVQSEKIIVRVVRVKTAISAKKNWIQRSVSKALLMVQRSIGVERLEHFLLQIMKDAESRINSMDELIMADYAKNWEICYEAVV
jgi:DNA relaxase NicK